MANEIVGQLHPKRKRFETHEIQRPPVDITPTAQAWISSGSAQGRIFPQAISEVFGRCSDLENLHIDIVPMRQHFPHETTDEDLCVIEVLRRGRTMRLILLASVLRETHANGHPAFHALEAAEELLRIDDLNRKDTRYGQ